MTPPWSQASSAKSCLDPRMGWPCAVGWEECEPAQAGSHREATEEGVEEGSVPPQRIEICESPVHGPPACGPAGAPPALQEIVQGLLRGLGGLHFASRGARIETGASLDDAAQVLEEGRHDEAGAHPPRVSAGGASESALSGRGLDGIQLDIREHVLHPCARVERGKAGRTQERRSDSSLSEADRGGGGEEAAHRGG